jgi:dTDP-4-dehydrorhamnose 3,5-epimerase
MIFSETPLPGVYVVEPERLEDERGFFARTFCRDEFEARGLAAGVAQCSVSFNARRHTLRGMHFQAAPHDEAKLVRCTHGAVYDVVVDLRRRSSTYLRWTAVELTAENRRMLYIPEACAHGFLTLCDATELLYQISTAYEPGASRGVRWNDPAFGIRWPHAPRVISPADRSHPDFAA